MIYFLLVDRFLDGDPANNGAVDLADPQAFHGGDLAGVTAKLDYLRELGVDTLWLGPITQMRTEKFHGWGAYHGYWLDDPLALEPRFGATPDLDALARGARARGIGLVLDTVYNHVAPDHPLVSSHPQWFNHRGPITDWQDPDQLVRGEVHGLPDLDVDQPEVRDWLGRATDHWISVASPAALRLDAVRHLPAAFVRTMGDRARARGVPVWGEVFDGNVSNVVARQREAALDAVFDYPLYYALRDVVCGSAPVAQLAAVLDRGKALPGEAWITFVDNHDTPRVASACGAGWEPEAAIELIFALRGRPMITWGTEFLLAGADEPDNRADMRWAFDGQATDRVAWLRSLAERRRGSRALSRGSTRVVALGDDFAAWERQEGQERRWVVYNEGDGPVTVAGVTFDGRAVSVFDPGNIESPRLRAGWHRFASDVHLAPGDRLRVVGDAPELGAWDPARGIDVPGRVKLAAEAYTYKLVTLHADGRPPTWEGGANRWVVGAGRTLLAGR